MVTSSSNLADGAIVAYERIVSFSYYYNEIIKPQLAGFEHTDLRT